MKTGYLGWKALLMLGCVSLGAMASDDEPYIGVRILGAEAAADGKIAVCPKELARIGLLKQLRNVVRETEVQNESKTWSSPARRQYAAFAAATGLEEFSALAAYMSWSHDYESHSNKAPDIDAIRFHEGYRLAWFPETILEHGRQRIAMTGNDTTENNGGLFTYYTPAAQLIETPTLFAHNVMVPRVRVTVKTTEELERLLDSPNLAFIPSLVLDFSSAEMPLELIAQGLTKGKATGLVTELRIIIPVVPHNPEKTDVAVATKFDVKPLLLSKAWADLEILSVAFNENNRVHHVDKSKLVGLDGFTDKEFGLHKLTQLRLHSAGITGVTLGEVFASSDFKPRGLTVLKLNANPLELAGAQALWAKHGTLPELQVLDMSYTGLGSEAIEWFVSDVEPHRNLRRLYLYGNNLGDTGIQTLNRWRQTLSPKAPFTREYFKTN